MMDAIPQKYSARDVSLQAQQSKALLQTVHAADIHGGYRSNK